MGVCGSYDAIINRFHSLTSYADKNRIVNKLSFVKIFAALALAFTAYHVFLSLKGRAKKDLHLSEQDKQARNVVLQTPSLVTDRVLGLSPEEFDKKILLLTELKDYCASPDRTEKELDSILNPKVSTILPYLDLGNQSDAGVRAPFERTKSEKNDLRARFLEKFIESGYKTVITCSGQAIEEIDQVPGVKYHHFGFGDTKNNPGFLQKLPGILEVMHEEILNGRKVLIHCNAGAHRSPSCVIAYLILLGQSFDQAYRYVKTQRLLADAGNFEELLTGPDIDIPALQKRIIFKNLPQQESDS